MPSRPLARVCAASAATAAVQTRASGRLGIGSLL